MTLPLLLRRLLLVLRFGLWVGLLYGATISLLHVVHNRVDRPLDALLTLLWLGILYALLAAPLFVAGAALGELFSRGRHGEHTAGTASSLGLWRARSAGLIAFHLVFWEAAALYGLTYDQTVIFHPRTAWGMTVYLALLATAVLAAVVVVSFVLLALLRLLEGHPRRIWAIGIGVVALHVVAALIFARPSSTREPSRTNTRAAVGPAEDRDFKVCLIGFDGLDPAVLERALEQGELPTFARLQREGASGELATLPHANSAVIWASLYSGLSPREHGILDFYRLRLPGMSRGLFPVHRTYFKEAADRLTRFGLVERDLVSRGDMARAPLWEVVDHAGSSLGLVDGYYYSFPALEVGDEDGFFLAYGADGFARQLESGAMDLDALRLFVAPKEVFPEVQGLLDQEDFAWQTTSLLRLLDTRPQPRLLNLYTHQPDTVQHQGWRNYQPEKYFAAEAGNETANEAEPILDMYRRFDRFLEALLTRLEPGTAVVIASDHGHSPTLVHALDTQHRHGPPGVLLLHGAPFEASVRLENAHIYDLFPTLLHLLGLPVPEDVPGRVLAEALIEPFASVPVRRVPSYDWLGMLGPTGPGRNDALDAQEIEKLKALGYL